jgi:LysR family transcriptional activator of mexEF-oprN operon
MNTVYARDLDLNLLRVFVVVAETGSVTAAAAQLYLTQPAISAALKRLSTAIGAPLFARAGRGLALTTRGQRLLATARPHLAALAAAAMSPERFDPRSSERIVTLGLSDANEHWLLPPLLRRLARAAPRMRIVVVPVHFRNVAEALASRVDLAVSVADDLPQDIRRQALFTGGFVCVYDPRHAEIGRTLTRARYLAHEHVIVSYNGDLRGLVEDLLGVRRNVRVSVASFQSVGAIVEGTAMLATVPALVAREILRVRRGLRAIALPFALAGTATELLWRRALDDDDAVGFVRGHVVAVATEASAAASAQGASTP